MLFRRSTARNSKHYELYSWLSPDTRPCWCSGDMAATPTEGKAATEVPLDNALEHGQSLAWADRRTPFPSDNAALFNCFDY
eukprot:1159502-Pelagomonas_calceolata.AAC.13